MRIAMVSEHASPLAVLGGVDAGGQNVHVAALAAALGRMGDEVVVHTRRDAADLPRRVALAPGVHVDHVDAGPARELPKDELLHVPVACAGCRAKACPVPGHPCLDDLPVAAVVAAVDRLAGLRAAGPEPLLEVAS